MFVIENKKVFGIGRVTDRGIVYNNLFYSCDVAITKRWFEKALVSGPWIIFVIFDQNTPDKLSLIEPISYELVTCYSINQNTESGKKLDRYFQSIQRLKETRRCQKAVLKIRDVKEEGDKG